MNKTETQGVNVKLTRNNLDCKVGIDGVMVERVKGVKINHNVDENGGVPSISITVVPKKLTVEGDGFDCHTSTTTKETAVRKTLIDRDLDEILSLIGSVQAEKQKFRDNILDHIYKNSTLPVEPALKSIYSIISVGVNYRDSLDFLIQAELLYISFQGEAGIDDCVAALSSIGNAYGDCSHLAVEGYVFSILDMVRFSATDIDSFLLNIGTVLPVAKCSDISFKDLLFIISQLTNSGVSTTGAILETRVSILKAATKVETAKNAGFTGFVRRVLSWFRKP